MPADTRKRRSPSTRRQGAGSHRQPLGGAARGVAGLMMIGVAALATLSAAALMSSVYSELLDSSLQGLHWRFDTLDLSRRAVALAPWRSATRVQQAQLISATRQMDQAVAAAAAALERAPADARTWVYWARLRGAADHFDVALLGGYRLAVAQAPNAWNVRESIALDGVMRWRHGDEALRQVWTDSIEYAMYRRRKEFSREIIHYGRDPYFCATVGQRLPLQDWCALTARARVVCADPKLKPAGVAWCERGGFLIREASP